MTMEEAKVYKDWLRSECIKHFDLAKGNCPYVDLSKEECEIISKYAKAASEAAIVEERQAKDSEAFYKRFYTGFLGEYAISKYLGCPYKFHGSFPGGSYTNKLADLSYLGYKIGIKCSHVGRTIKVHFNSDEIQLICQYKELSEIGLDYEKHYTRVYIMGFLKPEYINTYCKRDYIEEENVRKKGTKGGFLDFERLTPFSVDILEQNKFSVQVNNFIYKELTEDIVNMIKKSCNFMEKLKGYELGIIPVPNLENSAYWYFTCNTDFQKESVEEQENILDILSQRIVIGYGVSGYLHKLQNCYQGSKSYDIKYVDLHEVIEMQNIEDAISVDCEWINRLYSWVDYFKKYSDVPKGSTEHWYNWHYRLSIAFLEYVYSNQGREFNTAS